MTGTIADWKKDDIVKAEADPVRIEDPGVGKEVILRHFFFKTTPQPNMPRPTKQQIVSQYKKLIEISLWGDGYIIREDRPLEVHTRRNAKGISKSLYMKMVEEGADFVIMCLATPRGSQVVTEHVYRAT